MARKDRMPASPVATAVPPRSAAAKVPVAIRASGAREVVVTGDFTQWSKEKVRLTPISDGLWTTTLELAPGEYQYRLLVDGEWRDDPQATRRVPNPFGTQNCVLIVA